MRPDAPAAFTWSWRIAILAASVAYATVAAMTVRGLVGGFGIGAAGAAVTCAGTMAAMLAVLPMAAIIDVPEALWGHWLPHRRWRSGRCPACAHEGRGERCPECGAPFERPAAWAADWSSLRRAAWVLVPAGAIGTAAGLAASAADERAFVREVEAVRAREPEMMEHSRARAWPASFSELRWAAGRGFAGPPPFESPKVPG